MCREAHTWYTNNPKVTEIDRKDEFVFYLAANDLVKGELSRDDIIDLKAAKYDNFDEFKSNYDKVHCIAFCNEKKRWIIESTCSCTKFQKEFICMHLF